MEKERRIKTLSIMALIVAVLGLTVAFAALSQTLTITGTASIPNGTSTWNVHFDTTYGVNGVDVSQTSSNGTSYGQHGDITVSGTSISGINAILTKPGESVTYGFQVKNEGNADAKISNFSLPDLVCSSSVDVSSFCNENIQVSLKYDEPDNKSDVKDTDVLLAHSSRKMVLKIEFVKKETTQTLPSDDVSISFGSENSSITINYVQG